MANFNNITITESGAALLASSIAGDSKLEFSHIAVGSGVLAEEQDIATMTELVSHVVDLPIESMTSEGGAVILTANLNTASVPTTFMHREVGIYAGDTLVAYGNAGDEYDAIPATGGATALSKTIRIALNVASGSTSFRDIDSEHFVTYAGLESRIGEAVLKHAEDAASTAIDNKVAAGDVLDIDGFYELLSEGYETLTLETPAGSDNATCNIIILDPARVPNGLLTEISYRTGSSTASGMTTAPLWLAVWEIKEGSTSEYEFIGISLNTVTQTINSTLAWAFDRLPLHGRRIKLIPTTSPTQTETTTAQLRIRTSTSTDTTVCLYNGSSHNFCPKLLLTALKPTPRFAPYSHTAESDIHITAEERERWNNNSSTSEALSEQQQNVINAFVWDTTYGLSVVHRAEDGSVDGRLRVMVNPGTVSLVTPDILTLQATLMALVGKTGYSCYMDTTTGLSYSYGGHTMSPTEMEVYGITEACTWCGDPKLPLHLRGTQLRINGSTVDVEKLTQLLTNADSILAALNN